MFGLGPAILKFLYTHLNFNGSASAIEHAHPAGVGGNGVFPTTTYTTNAGAAAVLMHKPEDNGSWVAEAHLAPAGQGMANPLAFQILTAGYTVRVTATGVQVSDADNTIMFEVP